MIYLTFGDIYSGIFQSQVIDVLKYINKTNTVNTKLISFVPYPIYKEQRQLIKSQYPNSQILPMIPSRNHWVIFYSFLIVCFSFFSILNQKVVCRNIWSTNIGLLLRKLKILKWVCCDGRGAVFAEWQEYLITNTDVDLNIIYKAEKNAVRKADYRMAVSTALVNYWEMTYQYKLISESFSVIPCTIAESFEIFINDETRLVSRQQLGYTSEDTVIVFSGGIDKWQSPELLGEVMENLKKNNKNIKFLFLAKPEIINHPAISPFKALVKAFWVKPDEVKDYLIVGDFGLLIREKSVTNRVAAPTKFGEYLACGLEVVITEALGDYTSFVKEHNCGIIYNGDVLALNKTSTRTEMYNLAINNFSKRNFSKEYGKIYN
ncbi:glycosyltransferase involved in cell wall biosynthesis [Gelidibacter algens]|uniref:Glycosyltransferase involved in cell wall biosynthesis n=1 Tax=Gelidibacter algens TaxID=49280 RepID=A0A1A7R432_9FLAO|nr:hypothetical protein [Gelidibacter algens]OBX25527.1 hypothetical protein A9996_09475 [Gelidibacter algens]RAJ22255.1 glycosyltransferase involved in cell wall biosynthesis [Gelidibacter algens]